jgi:LmbE family N-acetylglucosaminyl deacetylase
VRILVVAAHPDDEVLGCGGTIARRAAEGHEVQVLILGEGATARGPGVVRAVERLAQAARAAARILGAAPPVLCGLPDNRFDTLPLLEVVQRVEREVRRLAPTLVYTHAAGDLNVDHALTCRAVVTATRPVPGCAVTEVASFEVLSSSEWSFGTLAPPFRANDFVDVTATLATKVRALEAYADEMQPFPHPRSADGVRAAAALRGSQVGVAAAEAFELVRRVH